MAVVKKKKTLGILDWVFVLKPIVVHFWMKENDITASWEVVDYIWKYPATCFLLLVLQEDEQIL